MPLGRVPTVKAPHCHAKSPEQLHPEQRVDHGHMAVLFLAIEGPSLFSHGVPVKIPIPPPDLPKVFVLTTPQHWMRKLYWEIAGFTQAEETQGEIFGYQVLGYWAANCAITAWHMTDWVWASSSVSEQRALMEDNNFSGNTLRNFQTSIRANSRDLHYCREIANGSKHFQITRANADAEVQAQRNWSVKPAVVGELRAGEPLAQYVMELAIVDGAETKLARHVFQDAFDYWDRFLRQNGYLEDRLIGADD